MTEKSTLQKKTLDPHKLAQLSKNELYMMLTTSAWKQLDEASRLALLQEMENRQAKLDNRPAIRVCAGKMDKHTKGVHRTASDGQETIILNQNFIRDSKLFAKIDEQVFSVAGAVNTVLHEGRHAYQHHAVKNNGFGLPKEQIMEWAAHMTEFGGIYYNGSGGMQGFFLYCIQSIEEDARRFARRTIQEINAFYRQNGIQDPNYINEEIGDRVFETNIIKYLRNYLTLDELNKIEKFILAHFHKFHPDIDVSKLTLFDSARLILSHPEIDDPDKMLDLIDKNADRKLGLIDRENMTIGDQVDRHTYWGGLAAKG